MLATKASLCTRLDAMGEDNTFDLGAEHKVKLEARLRLLEEGNLRRLSGTGKAKARFEKYHGKSEIHQYPTAADSTLPTKRKHSESEDKKPLIEELSPETSHKSKKMKKEAGFETPVKVKQEEDDGEGGFVYFNGFIVHLLGRKLRPDVLTAKSGTRRRDSEARTPNARDSSCNVIECRTRMEQKRLTLQPFDGGNIFTSFNMRLYLHEFDMLQVTKHLQRRRRKRRR